MAITMKKIADLANVSRGTVDRVLKNRGGVKPDTEQKIREIIKKHNYKPNRAGIALSLAKSPIKIGIILASIGNAFFGEVLQGIEKAKIDYGDYGVDIKIKQLKGYNVDEQLLAIDAFMSEKVNCIILTPINKEVIALKLNAIINDGVKVIAVNSDIQNCKRSCYIGCDYVMSGRTAAELVEITMKDYANVGIVTGSLSVLGHNQRIEGFKSKVCENPLVKIMGIIEGKDDNELAYFKTKRMLLNFTNINVIYIAAAGVDGVVRAVKESGRKVKIIAHDSTESTMQYVKNRDILATICQEPFLQGYNSVKFAFDSLINCEALNNNYYTSLSIKISSNID